MPSLFISYSRKDTDCARRLTEAFKSQDLDFWIDWEGIPPTVDWWSEVERGIEQAGVFLFLVSPDSIRSKICRREIDYALRNGKRLIPVVVREVNAEETPTVLSHLNWIFIRESDDFDATFGKLITAIKTDYEWVRVHRDLQGKALEWDRSIRKDGSKRDESFLLRGTELQLAELQVQKSASKDPRLTELQQEYLRESRQEVDRQKRILDRQRTILTFTGIIVGIALVILGAFGWINYGEAKSNLATARAAEAKTVLSLATAQTAEAKAIANANIAQKAKEDTANALRRSEYQRLAAEANAILVDPNGNTETAALLSLHALHGGYIPSADAALVESLNRLYTKKIFNQHAKDAKVVRSVAYSPKGDSVLIGYIDGTADLYDLGLNNGKRKFYGLGTYRDLSGSEYSGVLAAEFSSTGNYILLAGSDGHILIWDRLKNFQSDIVLQNIPEVTPYTMLWSAKFSPDENYILVGTGNPDKGTGKIYLIERETGRWKLTFPNSRITGDGETESLNERFISDVEFSPDSNSNLVLSTSFDGAAILWDMDWEKLIASPRKPIEMTAPIRDGAFSNDDDGSKVLLGSDNGVAALYGTDGSLIREFYGHTSSVYRVAFHPSGDHILTASWDHTARLWDITTGQTIRTFADHSDILWSAALSPDGKYLLTGSQDKTARLWIADPAYKTRSIHDYSGTISFLPGGDRILTSGSDGIVWIWNVDTLVREKLENIGTLKATFTAVSAQGQWIAARSNDDNTITLWKETGGSYKIVKTITMEYGITTFVFSPSINEKESKYLLVGMDKACRAELVKLDDTNDRRSYKANCWVSSVKFTPDGRYIAIGAVGDIRIYEIDGMERVITCNGGTSSIAFSKDGKYLAAQANNDIMLWDWKDPNGCKLVRPLSSHTAGVTSIGFSPDGQYLLSTSGDGTARLWDTATWTVARILIGHKGAVLNGAFSPDSNFIVTGGADHTIRFWDMDYQTTMQRACSLLQRGISTEELKRYAVPGTDSSCPQGPLEPGSQGPDSLQD